MKKILSTYHVELVRDSGQKYDTDGQKLSSPVDVVNTLRQVTRIDNEPQEVFYVMALDTKNRIIALHEAFRGTVNACLVSPRDVMQIALLHNANAIILAHNHPSGEPNPSSEDVNITNKIRQACQVMQVDLIDHIILGTNGRYSSLREKSAVWLVP